MPAAAAPISSIDAPAGSAFDDGGALVGEEMRKRLAGYLAGFAAFVAGGRR